MVNQNSLETWGKVAAVGIVVFIGYLAFNDVSIANKIGDASSPWSALFWYYATNIGYVIILLSPLALHKNGGNWFKEFVAGVFLVLLVDITNFPRMLSTGIATDITARANSDFIIANLFMSDLGWNYTWFYWTYYLVIPVLLLGGIIYLLGFYRFAKQVNGL